MREKQNVDGIHGSIRASRWSNDHKCDLKPFDDTESYTEKKPVCPRCGHLLRLVLAFFGKQCDLDAEWAAKMALQKVDLIISVGPRERQLRPNDPWERQRKYC